MELSLFSVSYAGLWGQERLDLAGFLAKAAELGFSSVMLMGKRPHLAPLDTNDAGLDAVAALLRKHDLKCAAVAAYTDFAPRRPAEVPFGEMQLAYVASLCRMARALGSGVVRVFTAYEDDQTPPSMAWNHVVAGLRECAAFAADFGVTLAIQNHHDVALASDALLDLISEIGRPNVKLGFDAWSPALCGDNLYEAARQMAPHTAITTNADYVRLPRYRYRPELVNYERLLPDMVRAVPFGEGFIDFEAFFSGLADGGFDGVANFEMCSPIRGGGSLENLDLCARRYLEWMRRFSRAPQPSRQRASQ